MTLPSSGRLSMVQVNGELNLPGTTPRSLNDTAVRNLANVPITASAISISNLYGKTQQGWNLKNGGLFGVCQPAYSPELQLWVTADTNAWIYTTAELRPQTVGNFFVWSQPAPAASTTGGAAWGASRFVIAAVSGYFYHSTDGINWSVGTFPATQTPRQIIYANNLFVVVGDSGRIMTSPDGLSWTIRTSGTGSQLNSISYIGGRFYAVGTFGVILRSVDAVTWEDVSTPTTMSWQQIAYNGSLFVVVGTQVSSQNYCYSSTGAAGSWTVGRINDSGGVSIFGTGAASGIVWTGSQFVVTGTAGVTATSTNATTWTLIDKGCSLALGYVTVNNRIFNCPIGAVSSGILELVGTAHQPTVFIGAAGNSNIVGKQGAYSSNADLFVIPSISGTVLTSSDAVTWTQRRIISQSATGIANVGSVAYFSNGVIAATAGGGVYSSTNGTSWTTNPVTGASNLAQVAWNSTYGYVVVGGTLSTPFIYTSPDLVTWTARTSPVAQGLSFVVNGSRFVALGYNGAIIYSTDGITWTSTTLGTLVQFAINLIWTGSQFIASYLNGTLLTSPDGITWTTAATATDMHFGYGYTGLEYFGAAAPTPIRTSQGPTASITTEYNFGGTIADVYPSLNGGVGGKGIGILFGSNGTIIAKVPRSFNLVSGTVLPSSGTLGVVGAWPLVNWISLQNASVDDAFVTVPLPFTFLMAGTGYTTAYMGSNTYITFGSGSTVYSGLSASNPALPKFFLGAADNSYQRVAYYTGGTDYVRIRYEGNGTTSGTVGSPGIVLEITIFNPAKSGGNQFVQVSIGVHNRTTGLFGVASSSAYYATLASGAWTANQSYVFLGNSTGTSWSIYGGYYIKPN